MNKTVATASMIASLSLGVPTRRRGSPYLELATAHGTAAALKAEAPASESHDLLAIQADSMGFDGPASHHARMAKYRADQRAARKVRMTAKRRRGW